MTTGGTFQPQPFSDSVIHLSFKLHLFPVGNIPSISRGCKYLACCPEGVPDLSLMVEISFLCKSILVITSVRIQDLTLPLRCMSICFA